MGGEEEEEEEEITMRRHFLSWFAVTAWLLRAPVLRSNETAPVLATKGTERLG